MTQIQIISTPSEVQKWIEESVRIAIGNLQTESMLAPISRSKPLTAKELCAFLGISQSSLIRWRKKSLIPSLRVGGSIRYDREAVVKAIEQKKGGRSRP
jgi:excisionase family DNA binding protein